MLSLGVPIFTVLPITTAEYVDPLAGAAPNLTVLPSKTKPCSPAPVGAEVPALGFCKTPLIINNI